MRVIFSLLAIAMLVVAADPASAVCINRAGAVQCTDDKQPKYAHFIRDEKAAAQNPEITTQPIASDTAAWVLTPQAPDGATILGIPGTASDCAADSGC